MPELTIIEGISTLAGWSSGYLYNYVKRRPLNSGIYKHVLGVISGYCIGRALQEWTYRKQEERLNVLEDYVKLHPDDFQPEPPKTYKDLFQTWTPVR